MPVKWNLRECLRERGFIRASQVSKIVRERTGYVLSTQAVCDLFNEQPKMLRLETGQALCDAFYCCLSDFFEVMPSAVRRPPGKKPLLPDTASSPDNQMIETRKAAGNDDRKDERSRGQSSSVDFASFFPDARKFPS